MPPDQELVLRGLLVAGSRKNQPQQIKEIVAYFSYITSIPDVGGAIAMLFS